MTHYRFLSSFEADSTDQRMKPNNSARNLERRKEGGGSENLHRLITLRTDFLCDLACSGGVL